MVPHPLKPLFLVASLILLGLIMNPRLLIAQDETVITNPRAGESIQNRREFAVEGIVGDYLEGRANGYHFWVCLAESSNGEVGREYWPKFYIKSEVFSGRIFDGGFNPLPHREEKAILILKVDEATNNNLTSWFKRGTRTGRYPGIPVRRSQIIANTVVYFP